MILTLFVLKQFSITITVRPVTVTIAYNDSILAPKEDLLILKIIGHCDSRIEALLPIPTSVTETEVLCTSNFGIFYHGQSYAKCPTNWSVIRRFSNFFLVDMNVNHMHIYYSASISTNLCVIL